MPVFPSMFGSVWKKRNISLIFSPYLKFKKKFILPFISHRTTTVRGSKGCIILLNMILGWWIQNCRHLLLNNNSCFRQKFRVNTQQLQEIIFTCWKISMMVRLGITTVVAPAFFPRSPTAGFLFIWTIHILPALRTGNILKFCGFPNCQKNVLYIIGLKIWFF